MKRKTKKQQRFGNKKVLLIAGVIALALLLILFIGKAWYYKQAADQVGAIQMRELILQAVNGLKKEAPVDTRTGDIYFPESRLYLPNPGLALPLTYLWDKGNVTDSQGELSVSTRPVKGTTEIITASNNTELFAAVPKLQACSRGVKLVYQKFPADDTNNQLKHTVQLDDGRVLYVYIEKECPELNEIADLFKNVKTY